MFNWVCLRWLTIRHRSEPIRQLIQQWGHIYPQPAEGG